jgi:CheY-like chemotaxis protein
MERPSILIVDDEENVRAALARWFSLRGFDVKEAIDGIDAIVKFGQGEYDVVTLDLEMPRMGGLDALKEIRSLNKTVPILVVTGYTRDAEIALERGAAKVLHKPLHLHELEQEVREAMDAKPD